jgi:hypothetical protein
VESGLELKKALSLFRDLLNASWSSVLQFENVSGDEHFNDFRINWLQGNWELTVEQSLLKGPHFLEIYGEGADFGTASSRVFCPEASPTHRIICHVKLENILLNTNVDAAVEQDETNKILFDSFVKITDEGWYKEAPDFDCVLADYGNTQIIFKFTDAEYSLEEIVV